MSRLDCVLPGPPVWRVYTAGWLMQCHSKVDLLKTVTGSSLPGWEWFEGTV